MIFGNVEDALDGEQTILENISNNLKGAFSGVKKQSKFSKILTTLSNYGMNYGDDLYKNLQAIPADKILQDKDNVNLINMYNVGWFNDWKIKQEEEKPFSEKTFRQKRDILRKLAMQPELEDILDVMSNESIVYDDELTYVCTPYLDNGLIYDLNEKISNEIEKSINTSFYKIYLLLNLKIKAWDIYKRFLIEGVLSYEIVYDNLENPKSIINLVDLDPATLTREIVDGVIYWVQFKGVLGQERRLLDSQVIYIKFEDSGVSTRQSYLERLIRPFNLYRIIEQAQIIWTVTQSSFKTLFTIPVGDMGRAKGIQSLAQIMNRYKEDINFNIDTGELKINDKVNMPFNKEYWLPQNTQGRPEIETLTDNGPVLNDSDQIKFFENKLYKMSKIPANRFDKEAQATWFGTDPTAALREEIDFARYVNRLRNTFAEIILKPLRIQTALSIPNIKNDKRILNSISLRWNSYNLFEEMMNIEVMTKRVEFISTMKDSLTVTDAEGNESSYFSIEFLLQKYLKLSDSDFELNQKMKNQEALNTKGDKDEEEEKGEDEGSGDEELGGDEEGGGSEEEGGDEDIDSEMLGDVQPESSETTQI